MIERGIIEQINARGRITVRVADRRVFADIHGGSGGCVGDVVEGQMHAGMQSWRNVGNSILSVVHVVAIEPVPSEAAQPQSPCAPAQDRRRSATGDIAAGGQNSSRKSN